MTDERLRLAIPDDQVCSTCQAVVMNVEQHNGWHTRLAEHIAQRIAGVERHVRANAQQAKDLIDIEQRDREAAIGGLHARIDRLTPDTPDGYVVTNMSGDVVVAYLDVPDGLYRITNGVVLLDAETGGANVGTT